MKRFYPAIITFLILALPIQARKSWEVREKGISAASVEKILADTENWKQTIKDGVEDTRATNLNAFTGEVKAQGEILPEFSELYFANVQANTFEVRWQEGNAYFRMNKDVQTFTIKKLVAGQTITIITKSANSSDPRGIECKSGHCTRTAGAEKMTGAEGDNINVFQVNADITDSVDVAFGPNVGGLLIYSVIVDEGDEEFDFSESKVAYLYDASTQDIDSDPFFNYTKIAEVASESVDIKDFSSADTDTLSALENYDLVVLSYGLKADHPFVAMLKKEVNRVPILNLNASLNEAWGWASLKNPSNAAEEGGIGTIKIPEGAEAHAIYADIDVSSAEIALFFESDPALLKCNLIQAYQAVEGGLFANDSVLAVVEGPAGTFNAIHEHASANTYMLIPFGPDAVVVEGESNLSDDAISLINNAVNYLIESKATVVAVMTPSISSDYRDELTIVSIKCATPDATVYYTTDGSEPTENSPIYTAPFQVTEDSTLVKAFAVKQGYDDSKTAAATILVKKVAKTPVIVLEAQEGKTVVSITCATEDATVYYNYTGSKSIAASAVYTAPIEVRYPLTITAFASGGTYIDSDITSKEIGVTGITKDNIRLDTLAHFDANSTDWYWETEGGSSKVAYYVGKNAKSAYASIDTIVEGNDTTYNYHFVDDVFIYAQNDSLNAKDNGWFMRTKGQVLQWENTNPLMEVGYAGATGYYADAVEDMITTPTRYHITFGPKKSGEPFTASIETSQKHQGPFDIITFAGNNNSDGASMTLVLETSLDGSDWTTVDTLKHSYYRRFWKRNVSHYEGSDQVFVRVTQVSGSTKAVVYDILLMNNGEVSQGYVALPVQRQAAEVIATEYYNLNGIRMAGPAYQGITIVKKIYSDGHIKVEKIFIK